LDSTYHGLFRELKTPHDPKEVKKLRGKAVWLYLFEGMLYRRGYIKPLLKCVANERADYILATIHDGDDGSHVGSSVPVGKCLD